MHATNGTVSAEGAVLYYESVGDGPPVMILQADAGGAGTTGPLAGLLAAAGYRVITHDRRGLSRSPVTGDTGLPVLDQHAADAALILRELTDAPALVVAAGTGALIGLHLAVDHPSRVSVLIAHEPPMFGVVPDDQRQDDLDRVEILAESDPVKAYRLLAETVARGDTRDGPLRDDGAAPAAADLQHFFTHDLPAVRDSTLDLEAVDPTADVVRVIPTGGTTSADCWEHRCAFALAAGLGEPFVYLAGGHDALVTDPGEVAEELLQIFAEETRA